MIAYDRNFSREITLQNENFETLLKKKIWSSKTQLIGDTIFENYGLLKRDCIKIINKGYQFQVIARP